MSTTDIINESRQIKILDSSLIINSKNLRKDETAQFGFQNTSQFQAMRSLSNKHNSSTKTNNFINKDLSVHSDSQIFGETDNGELSFTSQFKVNMNFKGARKLQQKLNQFTSTTQHYISLQQQQQQHLYTHGNETTTSHQQNFFSPSNKMQSYKGAGGGGSTRKTGMFGGQTYNNSGQISRGEPNTVQNIAAGSMGSGQGGFTNLLDQMIKGNHNNKSFTTSQNLHQRMGKSSQSFRYSSFGQNAKQQLSKINRSRYSQGVSEDYAELGNQKAQHYFSYSQANTNVASQNLNLQLDEGSEGKIATQQVQSQNALEEGATYSNALLLSESKFDSDYQQAQSYGKTRGKRMNWTFLNDKIDNQLFTSSHRKIREQRLAILSQIETENQTQNDKVINQALNKQKRFNSQAMSKRYYDRVMTPLNYSDRLLGQKGDTTDLETKFMKSGADQKGEMDLQSHSQAIMSKTYQGHGFFKQRSNQKVHNSKDIMNKTQMSGVQNQESISGAPHFGEKSDDHYSKISTSIYNATRDGPLQNQRQQLSSSNNHRTSTAPSNPHYLTGVQSNNQSLNQHKNPPSFHKYLELPKENTESNLPLGSLNYGKYQQMLHKTVKEAGQTQPTQKTASYNDPHIMAQRILKNAKLSRSQYHSPKNAGEFFSATTKHINKLGADKLEGSVSQLQDGEGSKPILNNRRLYSRDNQALRKLEDKTQVIDTKMVKNFEQGGLATREDIKREVERKLQKIQLLYQQESTDNLNQNSASVSHSNLALRDQMILMNNASQTKSQILAKLLNGQNLQAAGGAFGLRDRKSKVDFEEGGGTELPLLVEDDVDEEMDSDDLQTLVQTSSPKRESRIKVSPKIKLHIAQKSPVSYSKSRSPHGQKDIKKILQHKGADSLSPVSLSPKEKSERFQKSLSSPNPNYKSSSSRVNGQDIQVAKTSQGTIDKERIVREIDDSKQKVNVDTIVEESKLDPQKEYKQSTITNSIEPRDVSRRLNSTQLIQVENPFNRMRIRESDIPLEALYNREVNAMKKNERIYNLHQRPLSLSIWKNYDGQEGHDMTRIHVNQQELVLEHEYQTYRKKKNEEVIEPKHPDADVGMPLSDHLQGLNLESIVNRKAFSPTSLTGLYEPLEITDEQQDKLVIYAHNLYLRENFPEQVRNMTQEQRHADISKMQRRVTMRFSGQNKGKDDSIHKQQSFMSKETVLKSKGTSNMTASFSNPQPSIKPGNTLHPQSTINRTKQAQSMSQRKSMVEEEYVNPQVPDYQDTRYAMLLEECLRQVASQEEDRKKNNRRFIQEPKIAKDKYKLKIVKPDLNYLLSNTDQQMEKHKTGDLGNENQSLKVATDESLMRVMAKQYYGKWYLDPSQWEKLQKRGFRQQEIIEIGEGQDYEIQDSVKQEASFQSKGAKQNHTFKTQHNSFLYQKPQLLSEVDNHIQTTKNKTTTFNQVAKNLTARNDVLGGSPNRERHFVQMGISSQRRQNENLRDGFGSPAKHLVQRSVYQKEFAITKLLDKIKDQEEIDKLEKEKRDFKIAEMQRKRKSTRSPDQGQRRSMAGVSPNRSSIIGSFFKFDNSQDGSLSKLQKSPSSSIGPIDQMKKHFTLGMLSSSGSVRKQDKFQIAENFVEEIKNIVNSLDGNYKLKTGANAGMGTSSLRNSMDSS